MAEIAVRAATLSDLDDFVHCSIALFAEDAGTHDPTMNLDWPREHGADSFRESLGDPTRLRLVACDDTGVIGMLSAGLVPASAFRAIVVANVGSLYVVPAARGAGVGELLVREFQAWAVSRGAKRMAVSAFSANEGAIRFYRRMGFGPHSSLLEGGLEPR